MAHAVICRPIMAEPGIVPSPVNVGIIVDKVTMGQVSLLFLRFSPLELFF